MKTQNILKLILTIPLIFTMGKAICSSTSDAEKIKSIHKMINDFPEELRSAPTFNSIAADEASKKSKVIYVDVRLKKEMKISMLKGAVSEKEFESNREKYKDFTVIPYCTIGYRSAKYTIKLNKRGFKAYNLEGGVLLWAFSGFNLFDHNSEVTYDVHVYGKQWNILPAIYNGKY